MSEIVAILLAAGRSRRMGAFKPLLPFGESTVIETCIRHLHHAGVQEIVVVIGHRAEEMRAHLAHLPVKLAVNTEAESEMGVSIARGIEQLSQHARAVLIALADQPAIPPEVIRSIINAHRTGARLVIPEWNKRGGHPVLVDLSYRDELLNLDSQRGLRAFFEAHTTEVRRVKVNSPYIARDMDTWDDYCALHEEFFGIAPPDV